MTTNLDVRTVNKPRTVRVMMFDVSLPWASFWYDLSNVMLIVGATAVLIGTYGTIKMGAVKERFSNERISVNEMETSRATESASIAQEEAARANKAAADANERAVKAALELAKFRAPRILSQAQQLRITEETKSFADTRFVVGITAGSAESASLADQIVRALTAAKWDQARWDQFYFDLPAAGVVDVIGVVIQTHPRRAKDLKGAVDALSNALQTANLSVSILISEKNMMPLNTGYLHLLVGPKP
jgi:hypothetical protein